MSSSMNTNPVIASGENINKYGSNLETLLEGLGSIISTIQSKGMSDALDSNLIAGYNKISGNMEQYASALMAVGTAVIESADNTKSAASTITSSISVFE